MTELWGEFLDTEWYREIEVEPPPPEPWTADPWRQMSRRLAIFMLPRTVLLAIAQPERMHWIATEDAERTTFIQRSVAEEGLREPLELTIDINGKLILGNGHHRLLATAWSPHFEMMPCYFTTAERIRAKGAQPLSSVLIDLLTHAVAVN